MKNFKSLIIVVVLMATFSVSFAGYPPPLESKINCVEKEKSLVDQIKTTESFVIEKNLAPVDVGVIVIEKNEVSLLYVKQENCSIQATSAESLIVVNKRLLQADFKLRKWRFSDSFHKYRYNKTGKKINKVPANDSGGYC